MEEGQWQQAAVNCQKLQSYDCISLFHNKYSEEHFCVDLERSVLFYVF